MPDAPDIEARRKLDSLGQKLAKARAAKRSAKDEIATVAVEALEAGVTKSEIAKRAGITRTTLDRLLAKK